MKRLLLWMVALLLACGCAQVVRGSASGSHSIACGDGHPIPGYSNQLTYPPGVPTMPPAGVHIVRCFAHMAQATAHGFALPVPRGTLIVHGVFLLPTGPVMTSQCGADARILGFAVPCPTVAPAASVSLPLQLPSCGTVEACLWQSTSPPPFKRFVFDQPFAGPPGYHGIGGAPDGHFVLIAMQAAAVRASNGDPELLCLTQPAIRKITIEGDRATLVACPEGSSQTAGHILLRWVHRGILVGVSFHGVNATNAGLDLVVARHLQWVSP